jgi:hypothetical protein
MPNVRAQNVADGQSTLSTSQSRDSAGELTWCHPADPCQTATSGALPAGSCPTAMQNSELAQVAV